MIFSVFQKIWVFGYSWSTLLWYRCYYPHRSRDALSPVCGIFGVTIPTSHLSETLSHRTSIVLLAGRASELKFLENVHPTLCHMSHVTCHVSHVTCHLSHVTCHLSHVKKKFFYFFFEKKKYIYISQFFLPLKSWTKLVKLVGGGSVITGPTLSSLQATCYV